MNRDSVNLAARRMTSRINNGFENHLNKQRDINWLLRERNQGAGTQVRNIGGTVATDQFFYFGLGGGNKVGP